MNGGRTKNKNDTSKHMISETPMHDTQGTTTWDLETCE
jgi:hypothetical protein